MCKNWVLKAVLDEPGHAHQHYGKSPVEWFFQQSIYQSIDRKKISHTISINLYQYIYVSARIPCRVSKHKTTLGSFIRDFRILRSVCHKHILINPFKQKNPWERAMSVKKSGIYKG